VTASALSSRRHFGVKRENVTFGHRALLYCAIHFSWLFQKEHEAMRLRCSSIVSQGRRPDKALIDPVEAAAGDRQNPPS
jgi:hypothetical protein